MTLENILSLIPRRAADNIINHKYGEICEIRLHADRPMTLTVPPKNLITDIICTRSEIEQTVEKMCRGSLHSFEQTLRCGYIPLGDGCRAGVCGTLSGDGVRDFSSVCIRIPRTVRGVGLSLCKRLISESLSCGMLIFSPPGEGKTTLLRDLASLLSSPPYLRRVAVIDTRCEIYRQDAFSGSCADIYFSYPKALGIELATRTMSPQYIVCDELGSEEAESVLSAQNCGVPLIATAHSDSLSSLLSRPAFSLLDKSGVFGLYVGIRRDGIGISFDIIDRTKRADHLS